MSRPASAMSIYSSMGGAESDPEFPEPGDLLGVSPAAGPPAAAVTLAVNASAEKSDTARVTAKGKGKAKGKGEAKIMITREEKVDAIVDSSTVESTWTVPRSSIAIRIDLSQSLNKLTLPDGRVLTLDAFIRSNTWGHRWAALTWKGLIMVLVASPSPKDSNILVHPVAWEGFKTALTSISDEATLNTLTLGSALDDYMVPYDDLDVPMEYPANLDFSTVFTDGTSANDPFTTTAGQDGFDESLQHVNVRSFAAAVADNLPTLPAPPPSSPPAPILPPPAATVAVERVELVV
ncbi:hypothetical protein B0H16DRAFT_1793594 [Mycena metata]|uniref:Uncharacterized protein n=1 Tax=Mycena metata TaxID=1033252 RepID=A0AAD7HGG7_9AGAR|nr:hypothetical protein B0H16DRAFT_1793594 [Mycena metata]